MHRSGRDQEMSPDAHRAVARRCRSLVAGINDRAAIDALLALADEHEARAAAQEAAASCRPGRGVAPNCD